MSVKCESRHGRCLGRLFVLEILEKNCDLGPSRSPGIFVELSKIQSLNAKGWCFSMKQFLSKLRVLPFGNVFKCQRSI